MKLLVRFTLFVFIFILFSCNVEDNIDLDNGINNERSDNDPFVNSQNSNIRTLNLSGEILNSEAISILEANRDNIIDTIILTNTNRLTSLDLSMYADLKVLEISNTANLRSVVLAEQKEFVGGISLTNNLDLQEINLDGIQTIGALRIKENLILEEINLVSLTNAAVLEIIDNKQVISLDLKNLAVTNKFEFSGNRKVRSLFLSSLISTEDFLLSNNKILRDVNLPIFKGAHQSLASDNNQIRFNSNESLEVLNLPELVKANRLSISGVLKEVTIPKLMTITDHLGLYSERPLEILNIDSLTTFERFNLEPENFSTPMLDALLRQLVNITPELREKEISIIGTPSAIGKKHIDFLRNNYNTVFLFD